MSNAYQGIIKGENYYGANVEDYYYGLPEKLEENCLYFRDPK